MPRNGSPCEGSTSVSAGSDSNAASESRNRASGSPSGSIAQTLTLVLIRGSSMSPEISTPRCGASTATRARASGRGPRSPATTRPPARGRLAVADPGERRRELGHAAPVVVAAAGERRRDARRPARGGGTARRSRRGRSPLWPPHIACAVRNSACVIATGAPKRAASHAALPTWSGWQWVAMIRVRRRAGQRRREVRFPERPRGRVAVAAVDQRDSRRHRRAARG